MYLNLAKNCDTIKIGHYKFVGTNLEISIFSDFDRRCHGENCFDRCKDENVANRMA